MGGFYGSIQIRTGDRDRVKAAAERVATARGIHCLIGPALNGWIGVYPESNGQDQTVGDELAREFEEYVLQLVVHDDDIFSYWLYQSGKVLDSYWSRPGYFGEEDHAEQTRMAGNPDAFRPLISEKAAHLAPLLDRKTLPLIASQQLEDFARVLNISNAVSAYEYLKQGESDGIKGRRKFVEVPAGQIEREADEKKRERNLLKAERERLKAVGQLLVREERNGHLQACAIHNGFVVMWSDYMKRTHSIEEYRNPSREAHPVSVDMPQVTAIASQRRLVAMAAGDRVKIWDAVDGWKLLAEIGEPKAALSLALSVDEKQIAYLVHDAIVITETASAREARTIPAEYRGPLAFHPSGKWLALGGSTLGLIDLDAAQPQVCNLFLGGKSTVAERFRPLIQAQMQKVDLDEALKTQRAAMEKALEQFTKPRGSTGLTLSAEQIAAMRQQMEQSLENMRAQFVSMQESGGPPIPVVANEQVYCLGFSRDGHWLWCGSRNGVFVYEWSDVPRQTGDMPLPKWHYALPLRQELGSLNSVRALAEEVHAAAVIFGDLSGQLYRIDLTTGESQEVMKLLGNSSIESLCMSADGRALGIARHDLRLSVKSGGTKSRSAWEIWSYPITK